MSRPSAARLLMAVFITSYRPAAVAVDCAALRLPSRSPIQQLSGHISSQDTQYQCGQPLFQLGIVAAMPMTSPTIKNQSTCRLGRDGASRAQSHAQRVEMTRKSAVLASRGELDGTRPLTK